MLGKCPKLSTKRKYPEFHPVEEWEFIASAKGRYGWGHHPYTQNTVEVFFGTLANVLSNVLVDYASTILQVGRSFSGYVASVHMCMYNMFR